MPAPRPLDKRVDVFLCEDAVPQPRYPVFSSAISDPVPAKAAAPAGDSVGSRFGLKPYSSISFFRSSSAAFLALRFFQKNRKPRVNRTIAAKGTMTATATMPPVDNPLEGEDAPTVAIADDLADDEAALDPRGTAPAEPDRTPWLSVEVEVMKMVVG
jgi:hypothetical protein